MIKKTILMLLVLVGGVMSANAADAVETTVYYAVPANVVKPGNTEYSVKINVNYKGDGDQWETIDMTKTDKTYFGKYIYSCTFTSIYGGLGCLQFQIYDGSSQINSHQIFGTKDWKAASYYNNKMGEYGNNNLHTYNYDKTVTLHCKKNGNWIPTNVHNYFYDEAAGDVAEATFPGNVTTENHIGWYDYKITGRPCSTAIVSNGSSGEGNQSGNITIGDDSEYWVTYDGTNTGRLTTAPDDYYIYTRSGLTSGNLGTICLPFNATVTGATVYKIVGKTVDGSNNLTGIYADPVTNLEAGHAYIFKATATSLTASYTDTYASAVEADGMIGNLSNGPVAVPTGNYIIKDNKIRKVAGGTITIGQFKAYITLKDIGVITNAPGLTLIDCDDNTTGIEGLEIENSQDVIYDMQGRQVKDAKKGLFIINGKKVLVK